MFNTSFLSWITASFLGAVFSLFAVDSQPDTSKLNYLLPINHLIDPKITLSVAIPNNFKQIESGGKILEFIPQGETPEKRSEIITLQLLIGARVQSSEFLTNLKSRFFKLATDVKILEETKKQTTKYQSATLAISYQFQGKNEVVYMKYYSGPADLAGVQETAVVPRNKSPKEFFTAIKAKVDGITKVIE